MMLYLSVYPELVEKVELLVYEEMCRRHEQSKRKVEPLTS